ncbi:heavy metal-binding protein HIP-like isoform X2 [Notolabrus celidotus]|uniref:heavy metal-binding protein HIP-like isoform X2 n=1 Tax=Notolabrus celidotus TaxID=1203425 RepID=UPI00148F5FAE|nr:heavy metal-binding protein HIP-like isoform X2 [Notolabrus celidotus]
MKGCYIVLLFCLSSRTAQTCCTSVDAMWNELKMLRDMVVEQRVELRGLESRMKDVEEKADEDRAKVLLLTMELGNMSEKVEEQRTELVATRNKISELEKENAVFSAELSAAGHRVEASEKEVDTLKGALSMTKDQVQLQKITVENLERANTGKIAFSVGLNSPLGYFETDTVLKYDKVFTNIGKAYNPTSGMFVAPIRGVYYFRFSAFGANNSQRVGVELYHNDQRVIRSDEYIAEGGHKNLSNALTLQLNEGDLVYMNLPKWLSLYDNSENHNTFSGFLLFSL